MLSYKFDYQQVKLFYWKNFRLESTLDAFFRYEYSAVYAKNPVFKRLPFGNKIQVFKKALHQVPDFEDGVVIKKVVTVFPNNKVCSFFYF
jgi:hypothetical protein